MGPEERKTPPGASPDSKRIYLASALIAALVTLAVFLPSLSNDFVLWDDDFLIIDNRHIRSLDFALLKWAFLSAPGSLWTPLVHLTFALDHALWGLEAKGFHLTNAVLHSVNAFLVALIVTRLVVIGRENGIRSGIDRTALVAGLVTALLFSLHPMRVESVVWASQRKDVLFALCYLVSVLTYLRYARKGGAGFYAASLVFFIMSLMSKPSAVTLPLVLLILDFYPLGRLSMKGGVKGGVKDAARLIIEKAPFLLFTLSLSLLTLRTNKSAGALQSVMEFTPILRFVKGVRHYILYLYKTAVPVDLVPVYPSILSHDVLSFQYLVFLIPFLAITVLALVSFKKNRVFTIAWVYYLVTLYPSIWITASADRFTYLAHIGPFVLVGLGAGTVIERSTKRHIRVLVAAAVLIVSGVLTVLTIKQTAVWKDSITLWSHQISTHPGKIAKAYINRGVTYYARGEHRKAIMDYDTILRRRPRYADAYYNRGDAYRALGDVKRAIEDYTRAVELKPGFVNAHTNLGNAYLSLKDPEGAIRHLTTAIAIYPGNARAYNNRGIAFKLKGEGALAIKDFTRAVRLNPGYTNAYFNRAITHEGLGELERAIEDYETVLRLNPRKARAHYKRALVYSKLGDNERAVTGMRKAAALGDRGAREYLRGKGLD
jgi:tetratricopeptide (TPR) repeat protein